MTSNLMPQRVKHVPYNDIRDHAILVENDNLHFNLKPYFTSDTLEHQDNKEMVNFISVLQNEHEILQLCSNQNVMDLVDLEKFDGIELPFLVEKLISKGNITVLGGESATGKSTLALQISTSIAQGKTELFSHRISASHNRVIYVSTEDGPAALQFRLKRQLDPDFDRTANRKNFRKANTIEQLESEIKLMPVDLVVIDTLADFCDCDLNNNTEMRAFFKILKEMMRKYGCTFLILHHYVKSYKPRNSHKGLLIGSQAIEAAARQVLGLSITKNDYRILETLKDNYLPKKDKTPINLRFDEKRMLFEKVEPTPEAMYNTNTIGPENKVRKNAPDEALLGKIRSLEAEGFNQREIAKEVKKSPATISRYLKR